jgi:hypothetical protein
MSDRVSRRSGALAAFSAHAYHDEIDAIFPLYALGMAKLS